MSIAQALSKVPPVPEEVKKFMANTPFASKHPSWYNLGRNIPQMVTALVHIEQSSAGRAWGVRLADVPMQGNTTNHTKYYTIVVAAELGVSVAQFFKKSNLNDSDKMVSVNWAAEYVYQSGGLNKISCDAIARMIYAVEEWAPDEVEDPDKRLAVIEGRVAALEAHIAALVSQNSSLVNRLRSSPAVTCLMLLFAQEHDKTQVSTSTSPLNIPPHTERISDLSDEAEDWLRQQLKARNLWVKVASMDSAEENHISWAPLEGGIEIGTAVIRKYGAYRFW